MADQKKTYKLDRDLIFKLASIHCTYQEIADCVGTSATTLEKRYKGIVEKGRAEGKKSLRRAQFMFLGKNWLGQQDSPTDEENTQPLPWQE